MSAQIIHRENGKLIVEAEIAAAKAKRITGSKYNFISSNTIIEERDAC